MSFVLVGYQENMHAFYTRNSTLVGAQHNHWTFVVEHAMTIIGSIRLDYHLIRSTAFSIGSSVDAGIQEAFDLGQ